MTGKLKGMGTNPGSIYRLFFFIFQVGYDKICVPLIKQDSLVHFEKK